MWLDFYQPLVSNLVQEALLNVCHKHVPHDGKLEIDGIVCISNGNIDKQIVVKIHEVIQQKEASSPDENANSSAPPRKSAPILQVPGFKRRLDDKAKSQLAVDLTTREEPEKKMSISLLKLLSGEEKVKVKNEDFDEDEMNRQALSPSSSSACDEAIKTPTCKICSSTFGSIEELVSHTLSEHKRYLCKRCLNSFSLRCNLHRHERLHSGIKPFPCNLCEKSFARNADLKLHLQKHETCSCTQCSKSFIDMHSLNYHLLKVHHAQDNMHACTICEKAFRSEQQYNKHWESHTNSLANHGQIEVGAGSDQEETNGEEPEVSEAEVRSRVKRPGFKSLLQPKLKPLIFQEDEAENDDSNLSNNNTIEEQEEEDFAAIKREFGPLFHMEVEPLLLNGSRGSSPALSDTAVKNKRKSRPVKHIIGLEENAPPPPKRMMSGGQLIVKAEDDLSLLDTESLSTAVGKVISNVDSPQPKVVKLKAETKPASSPSAEAMADDEVYYTCRYGGCGTQSFGFKAYEDHFFCVHGRFPCKLCDQSFTCKNNRTRHVRNHLGIAKKHTCDRCQKTFTRPDILQEHKMIHTLSYKSDQCNACGATFDRKALLLTHMKKCFRHRGDLLEKDMAD